MLLRKCRVGGWNLMVFDGTVMFWERASHKVIVSADQDDAHCLDTRGNRILLVHTILQCAR